MADVLSVVGYDLGVGGKLGPHFLLDKDETFPDESILICREVQTLQSSRICLDYGCKL